MNFKHSIAAIFMGLAGVFLAEAVSTQSIYTERSVEELKLMTTPELAGEARLIWHDILNSLEFRKRFNDLKAYRDADRLAEQARRGQSYLFKQRIIVSVSLATGLKRVPGA